MALLHRIGSAAVVALLLTVSAPACQWPRQGPSTYGLSADEVARIFYRWYVSRERALTCSDLAERAYLFEPGFLERLCPPGGAAIPAAALGIDAFTGSSRATGFRVRKRETMGDVCSVFVDLTVGRKRVAVILDLHYVGEWRIGDVAFRRGSDWVLLSKMMQTASPGARSTERE